MKSFVKILLISCLVFAIPMFLFAPPTGSWNPGNTDPTVPLDGGILFAISGAILYGIRKKFQSRK